MRNFITHTFQNYNKISSEYVSRLISINLILFKQNCVKYVCSKSSK